MKDNIMRKLIAELGYSERNASKTSDDLCSIQHADLRSGLLNWLHKGVQVPIENGDYSTVELVEKYHMTYPAALIFLNWYREDAVTASSVLKIRM